MLLNSTKHVLRILHALFHLMKNKIQVKENLQGCGVKIKILTLLKEKKPILCMLVRSPKQWWVF